MQKLSIDVGPIERYGHTPGCGHRGLPSRHQVPEMSVRADGAGNASMPAADATLTSRGAGTGHGLSVSPLDDERDRGVGNRETLTQGNDEWVNDH